MREEGARDLLTRMFRGEVVRTPPLRHDAPISAGLGQTRWVETLGFPVKDEGGALREVVMLNPGHHGCPRGPRSAPPQRGALLHRARD
jgi:hypothetical protein